MKRKELFYSLLKELEFPNCFKIGSRIKSKKEDIHGTITGFEIKHEHESFSITIILILYLPWGDIEDFFEDYEFLEHFEVI